MNNDSPPVHVDAVTGETWEEICTKARQVAGIPDGTVALQEGTRLRAPDKDGEPRLIAFVTVSLPCTPPPGGSAREVIVLRHDYGAQVDVERYVDTPEGVEDMLTDIRLMINGVRYIEILIPEVPGQ